MGFGKLADTMEGKPKYLSPEDDNFEEILFQNLVNKHTAWMLNSGGKEKISLGFGCVGV